MTHRTDKGIVEQTKELAIELARVEGWVPYHGEVFTDPREYTDSKYWQMAVIAQEFFTRTDANDALNNLLQDHEAELEGVEMTSAVHLTALGEHADRYYAEYAVVGVPDSLIEDLSNYCGKWVSRLPNRVVKVTVTGTLNATTSLAPLFNASGYADIAYEDEKDLSTAVVQPNFTYMT